MQERGHAHQRLPSAHLRVLQHPQLGVGQRRRALPQAVRQMSHLMGGQQTRHTLGLVARLRRRGLVEQEGEQGRGVGHGQSREADEQSAREDGEEVGEARVDRGEVEHLSVQKTPRG